MIDWIKRRSMVEVLLNALFGVWVVYSSRLIRHPIRRLSATSPRRGSPKRKTRRLIRLRRLS
jgi:hypothetical protein